MEYEQLNELIDVIQESLERILDSGESNANGERYEKLLQQKFFDFNEECRLNEKKDGPEDCILHFIGLREKFEYVYKKLFEHSEDGFIIYRPTRERINMSPDDIRSQTIDLKAAIINESIQYLASYHDRLKERISDQTIQSEKQPKDKTTTFGFIANFTSDDLKDCFQIFIYQQLIPPDTEYSDFVQIFTGKLPTSKLTWLGTNQELSQLIKEINGVCIEPLGKKIWDITTSCFIHSKGIDFTFDQLRHAGNPKDPSRINRVIDFFHTYSTL